MRFRRTGTIILRDGAEELLTRAATLTAYEAEVLWSAVAELRSRKRNGATFSASDKLRRLID
jgi:hypothetical protein